MKTQFHLLYIAGSVAAALIAGIGIVIHAPFVYGVIPGIIGGLFAGMAAVQFFRNREDLAGFIATTCGFVFYQAFQANPVILPEFTAYIAVIPEQDQLVGIVLSNLTTAMLLVSYHAVSKLFGRTIDRWLPKPAATTRKRCDGLMLIGFSLLFVIVALPNILFGKVIVGPIQTIIYQRAAWSDASLSGYEVFGGAVGGSFSNVGLWAYSLFLVWLYLLGSRFRWLMWLLSPLVLIWTAAIALQGSRTYLVTLAMALIVYVLGNPKIGRRVFFHFLWVAPLVFVLVQVSTIFRVSGLQTFDIGEFASHAFEIRGNEGASSEMDGIEYFRTELFNRDIAPNPLTGFFRGLFERPIEGAMMILPRSVFPWKIDDKSAIEYDLFFENVRLGVPSEEVFLGASPGMIGRELIHYGILGPFTLLFWMGLIMALANRLFVADPNSDFHRICAASLVAFFIAQSRDFVPVWFIPVLPVALILTGVALRSRKWNKVTAIVSRPREGFPAQPSHGK